MATTDSRVTFGKGMTDAQAARLNNTYTKDETRDRAYIDGIVTSATASVTNYETQATLLAYTPTVTGYTAKALDTKKVWYWDGSAWVDTGLSELDLAKADTAAKVSEVRSELVSSVTPLTSAVATINDNQAVYNGTGTYPIVADAANKILLGFDRATEKVIGAGLLQPSDSTALAKEVMGEQGLYLSKSTSVYPFFTDVNNKILLGYDITSDKLVGAFSAISSGTSKPTVAAFNHLLFYGQSLSVGATATDLLSTTQPYFNKTFNTSPRQDTVATSVIPLVEQFNNPASDGGTDRGETQCSGAANYASRAMQLENGINPANHVIFASTAGHGGYRIDQLEKGTAWYDFMLSHVTKAKALVGTDYKVQVVGWIQGENDAINTQQTPFATYRAKLVQLQKDITSDVTAVTLQSDSVKFITYQMSYASKTWSDQALAQLDLVKTNDNFALSTPMYHMPYATDSIHLTNVGYKWLGAYFGRAYKQWIVDNRKPDFLNPLVALQNGSQITVRFVVPKLPLLLDTTTLSPTTDHGFKVTADGTPIAISSIAITGDSVELTLASTPTGVVKVRYALDYTAVDAKASSGASGNLRDSTTDSVVIDGVTKPLYHICPHFELTATTDKGI